MNMKKFLTIVSESQLPECGNDMPPVAAPAQSGATMNITMNAQGADQIKSLLDIISRAETSTTPMLDANPMDLDSGTDMDIDAEIDGQDLDMDQDLAVDEPDLDFSDDEMDLHDDVEDSYKASTTPAPKYVDNEYMTHDLAGGLNKEKRMFKKAQDGDNAMAAEAIKAELRARYTSLKEGK